MFELPQEEYRATATKKMIRAPILKKLKALRVLSWVVPFICIGYPGK